MNLKSSFISDSDEELLVVVQDELEQVEGETAQPMPTTPGNIDQDGQAHVTPEPPHLACPLTEVMQSTP